MNPNAQIVDHSHALECLAVCAQVYVSPSISTEAAHALIVPKDNCVMVAFRGSKSAEDWLHDFDFPLITVAGGKVHEGFWESYSSIVGKLYQQLRGVRLPLVITGHSLGGAQATLFANNFCAEFPIASVITFGSPRVGNAQFVDNYNHDLEDKTLRWVDELDIVPRVPFGLGYEHVGHCAALKCNGGLAYDPGLFETIANDFVEGWEDFKAGKIAVLTDHHLENYKARLEALAAADSSPVTRHPSPT